MRIVLDTNILLAGLAVGGICEGVVDLCLTSADHRLVLSEHILREFETHFAGKFGIPRGYSRAIAQFLRGHADMVEPSPVPTNACRDPEDLPVLGTLIAGEADCLVTGDADLLSLGQYQGRPILSPRQLYQRLTGQP